MTGSAAAERQQATMLLECSACPHHCYIFRDEIFPASRGFVHLQEFCTIKSFKNVLLIFGVKGKKKLTLNPSPGPRVQFVLVASTGTLQWGRE